MPTTYNSSRNQTVNTIVPTVTTSIAAHTTVVWPLAIKGATPDMHFVHNHPTLDAGLIIDGIHCSTAGTVNLRVTNITASPITPAANTFSVIGI